MAPFRYEYQPQDTYRNPYVPAVAQSIGAPALAQAEGDLR